MKRALDTKLCKKYPLLYSDRDESMLKTLMCWGFACGDGWYKILDEASAKLEKLIKQWYKDNPTEPLDNLPRACQIKEKYGTLRFYLTTGTDEMFDVANNTEEQSMTTCEQCGEKGKLRGHFWLYTACDKHTKEADLPKSKRKAKK